MSDYYPETLDALPLFRRTDPATSKQAGAAAKSFRGEHTRRSSRRCATVLQGRLASRRGAGCFRTR